MMCSSRRVLTTCGLTNIVIVLCMNADQRKLGFSMRVERSTVDQVKNRLQSAVKRKWDPVMTKKLDAMEGASVRTRLSVNTVGPD